MPAAQQMAQLPPPQQREYRKRIMTQPYREPERVAAREGSRDARRMAASMPEVQYRSAAQPQPDPRSRPPERLEPRRREQPQPQPQPQQPALSAEQLSSPVRPGSRPNGIPLMERKQMPAYRRQDVDGRYGPGPGPGTSTQSTGRNGGETEAPSGQLSDRRPPFTEFLQAEVCCQARPRPAPLL